MTEKALCLDTSVFVKYLVPDEQEEAATRLVEESLSTDTILVAPTWIWAEIGSVLRKKVRAGLLRPDEADALWTAFLQLPIALVDTLQVRQRSWEIAEHYDLPTLYDAAFLACTELVQADTREFWTADFVLIRQLSAETPPYVRALR